MNLTSKLQYEINNIINTYIENISSEFNIDKKKLLFLWNKDSDNVETKVSNNIESKTSNNVESKASNDLNKLSKKELSALCKEKNLSYSGTKEILIKRLTSPDEQPLKDKLVKTKDLKEQPNKNVIDKLLIENPRISIMRNKYDNLEHNETNFVFDKKTKKVIGKQKDGFVEELTEQDIDLCNKYKFQYVLPVNLNKNTKDVEDVEDVDEVVEDEEEEVEEVEEVDEEEVEEVDEEEVVIGDDDIEYDEDMCYSEED